MPSLQPWAPADRHPIDPVLTHACSYESDGHFYIVMEFVAGKEVFEYLVEAGAFTEKKAARLYAQARQHAHPTHPRTPHAHAHRAPPHTTIFAPRRGAAAQVAEAVALLHAQDTCHADIKPENLLLTKEARDLRRSPPPPPSTSRDCYRPPPHSERALASLSPLNLTGPRPADRLRAELRAAPPRRPRQHQQQGAGHVELLAARGLPRAAPDGAQGRHVGTRSGTLRDAGWIPSLRWPGARPPPISPDLPRTMLLAGDRPLSLFCEGQGEADDRTTKRNICTAEPDFTHEVWGKVSKQGKALVKGLLRKDPQELRPLNPELRPLT